MNMGYLKAIGQFLGVMGIDANKWKLVSDTEHEEDHRELIWEHTVHGEYGMYCIVQWFDNKEWIIVELSIAGD
jgi:hypothetical protein